MTSVFCKYIKTIAQYHSFSKAAQVLYVSQPALSRFVKKVEDELGVTLFDRDTIPLRLTLAGQRYLEYVEQFFVPGRTCASLLRRSVGITLCPSAGGGGTKSVLGAQFGRLWTGE